MIMNKEEDKETNSLNETLKHVEWTVENELILVEWCDVALCYKWLHFRSYLKYSYIQACFTIPVIIMSTITGTISFAQSSFTPTQQFYVQFGVGTINIFLGILSTISQYLKINEYTESHKICSISWDKFSRNIRVELAKPPEERMDAAYFMKLCRHEFDRLMESSPIIQQDVIDQFKKTFQGGENTQQRKVYLELRKPDICDTIISSNSYRHKWYLNNGSNINTNIFESAEEEKERKEENLKQILKENILSITERMKNNNEKINNYIQNFTYIHGRNPLKSEIENHFQGEMDQTILENYFSTIDKV
jgi:hypothetical protein